MKAKQLHAFRKGDRVKVTTDDAKFYAVVVNRIADDFEPKYRLQEEGSRGTRFTEYESYLTPARARK